MENLRLRADMTSDLPARTTEGLVAIAELDLTRERRALIDSGAAPELADRVTVEFRRFLALPLLFPRATANLVPTVLVDDMWHALILDTRRYHDFCVAAYGGYLHHVPEPARTPPEPDAEAFREMTTLLRRAFDEVDDEVWTPMPRRCGPCMGDLEEE